MSGARGDGSLATGRPQRLRTETEIGIQWPPELPWGEMYADEKRELESHHHVLLDRARWRGFRTVFFASARGCWGMPRNMSRHERWAAVMRTVWHRLRPFRRRPRSGPVTEIRHPGRKFDMHAFVGAANTMILGPYPDGIGIASMECEGPGLRPWVFDPPPLVATFGRSHSVPIFFVAGGY